MRRELIDMANPFVAQVDGTRTELRALRNEVARLRDRRRS
jgi:hypothetical protein